MRLTDNPFVRAVFRAAGVPAILLTVILMPLTSCQSNASVIEPQTGLNGKQLEAANFELFRAAASGDTAHVNQLLDRGADVNAREEEG